VREPEFLDDTPPPDADDADRERAREDIDRGFSTFGGELTMSRARFVPLARHRPTRTDSAPEGSSSWEVVACRPQLIVTVFRPGDDDEDEEEESDVPL